MQLNFNKHSLFTMVKITFDEPTFDETELTTPDLVLTDAAAARIREIFARKTRAEGSFLRVTVQGGGCNGFEYKFGFDTERKAHDISVFNGETEVVVDTASYNVLQGSTIDFEETLEASQFVINNPNASTSCGCGNSFSV